MLAPATSPLERLRTYASFVRFEHTLFSLPLILAGVFSAAGPTLAWDRWALIGVAAVGARTAAMAMNRIIDRHIDAQNPRTRVRELPAGRMRMLEAWGLMLAGAAGYLAACAALGPFFLAVSPIPLAVFALYPWLKRFTPFCHFGVGLALALAPLAGYAAGHPDLAHAGPALVLAGFALVWVSGFDIIYATLDEDFDRGAGIRSMVAWLGRDRALRVSAALHRLAALLLLLLLVLLLADARPAAWWHALPAVLAFAASVALLEWEQRLAEDVDLAFFRINVWVGALVLAMVLAARAAGGL
jgi:4-hydroxybenzoate polyprenyltransferase